MTRTGCLGFGKVPRNAVLGVSTVGQGSVSSNPTLNVIEGSGDLDPWRRALGDGPIGMYAAGRIPIRVRVAHQRVLDEFAIIAKKCRKRRRLSIEAVAQGSGIAAKRVQQFERGAVPASEPEIVSLSAVYGVGAAVITRRLKRVYDQFAGDDIRAMENILHLKWSRTRQSAACHVSTQSAGVAPECRGACDGADHGRAMTMWPAFRPATLADSLLAECIQLLTLTTCIQAFVAQVASPVPIRRARNSPQPVRDGTKTDVLELTKGDELLALICSNLNGIVERLELLTQKPRYPSRAAVGTHDPDIGDVVPFPDQALRAERTRIADTIELIARYKNEAVLTHAVNSGTNMPLHSAKSLCLQKERPDEQSVSTLMCVIDQLSDAAYNLFQLSGHST